MDINTQRIFINHMNINTELQCSFCCSKLSHYNPLRYLPRLRLKGLLCLIHPKVVLAAIPPTDQHLTKVQVCPQNKPRKRALNIHSTNVQNSYVLTNLRQKSHYLKIIFEMLTFTLKSFRQVVYQLPR